MAVSIKAGERTEMRKDPSILAVYLLTFPKYSLFVFFLASITGDAFSPFK